MLSSSSCSASVRSRARMTARNAGTHSSAKAMIPTTMMVSESARLPTRSEAVTAQITTAA
ncbi:hypothetical protein HU144_06320 [Brevibacterium sp. UCMA 11752]|nr:hypothetical protein [Brevibacterium sp. UCMA 11752]